MRCWRAPNFGQGLKPVFLMLTECKCNGNGWLADSRLFYKVYFDSNAAEQSRADELLTSALKQALALVDVRVLDHFIVAGNTTLSFAERGLL